MEAASELAKFKGQEKKYYLDYGLELPREYLEREGEELDWGYRPAWGDEELSEYFLVFFQSKKFPQTAQIAMTETDYDQLTYFENNKDEYRLFLLKKNKVNAIFEVIRHFIFLELR